MPVSNHLVIRQHGVLRPSNASRYYHTATRIPAWTPLAHWSGRKRMAPAQIILGRADLAPAAMNLFSLFRPHAADLYADPRSVAANAARNPAFAARLVSIILNGATLADHKNGMFRGHPTVPRTRAANLSAVRVYQIGGNTTNTLLRVEYEGKTMVMKLFGQCRPGIQPEVEVGTFFACHARWKATPRFLGWFEHTSANGESTAVATIHDFTPDSTTAWDHLAPLMARGGLAGPNRTEILDIVRVLGRTTAEMHQVLASRPDIEAFTPVVAEATARQAETDRMLAHASDVFEQTTAHLQTLPAAATLRQLLANRDRFADSLLQLAKISEWGALIRIHGDYHLGQVLLRQPQKTATVIDFEGEPGRALADRRRKTTVLKDLAGMCRSFDYLLRYSARIGPAVYAFDHLCLLEETYLNAYRTVARDNAWWPTNTATAEALLHIYKLDKALYELAYELQNRPDWVEVPLAALVTPPDKTRPHF